jgi:hypothetical protein
VSVWIALSLLNSQAPHLIPGRSSPAGGAEGESVGTKLGGSQRSKSNKACSKCALTSADI